MQAIRAIVESTLVPHTAFQNAMESVRQCLSNSGRSPEPICLALVGESRTGKSRVLEETELLLPRSRTAEGAVVPILRVAAPGRPTVKGVAGLMLQSLGDPKWEAGTELNRTVRLKKLIRECQTLMIMLEEFQHFFDKGTHKIFHDAADWLKTLVDETGVTLVVSGLESCLPVLLRNEQLSGRFLAPVYMRRFQWLDDGDREEFVGILGAFNEAMSEHLQMPKLHDHEMAFRIWCASGGLMGHLTKLLRQAVWNACDTGKPRISIEQFEVAHRTAIWSSAGDASSISPFDRRFMVEPTQETVAAALTVGRRQEDTEAPHRNRRRRSSADTPLSQVLKGSGA